MYLKRVELKGFKSFADKTQIDLHGGITCVVGPNGSGKSNITDAVRWVLGEQRAKSLRGSKMEDVIFSGTKQRKSLGFAEVRLIFDNAERIFPIDYSEVVIARRLYRSGEGEYSINNKPVRLKDIRDLISDTGIGKEGYSIIGQGRIEEILASSKEERRLLFEEATGITKYKQKKTEAEKRLETANTHLEGLAIRLSEIQERIEPLRLESIRAQRHRHLTTELRAAELIEYAKRYRRLRGEYRNLSDRTRSFQEATDTLEKAQEQLLERQQQIQQQRHALVAQRKELRDIEFALFGQVEKNRSDQQLQTERLNVLQAQWTKLRERGNDEESGRSATLEELRVLTLRITEEERALARSEQELADEQTRMETFSKELIDVRNEAQALQTEAVRILNEAESKKRYLEQNHRAIEGLKNKQISILGSIDEELSTKERIEGEIEQLSRDLRDRRDRLEQLTSDRERATARKDELQRRLSDDEEVLRNRTREKLDRESELQIHQRLEDEFSGYDRGVREVLQGEGRGVIDVVGNLFTTAELYEIAIEVALGRNLGVVICESNRDAKREIERLRKERIGRVSFLSYEEIRRSGRIGRKRTLDRKRIGVLGFADELIETQSHRDVFEYFLGNTILVDTIDHAVPLLDQGYRIVTLEGDVLNPGGLMTGGSYQRRSGILSRKRTIRELTDQCDALAKEIRSSEASILRHRKEIEAIAERMVSLEAEYRAAKSDETESGYRLTKLEKQLDDILEISKQKTDAAEQYEVEIRHYFEENEQFQREIDAIALRNRELEAENDRYSARIGELEERDRRSVQEMTEKRVESAKRTEQLTGLRKEQMRLRQTIQKYLDSEDAYRAELSRTETQLEETKAAVEALHKDGAKLAQTYESTKSKREECEAQEAAFVDQEQCAREEEQSLRMQIDASRKELHQTENRAVRVETELEGIVTELFVTHNASIEEAETVTEGERSLAEIRSMKSELAELGAVNDHAIEEYRAVSEKHSHLSAEKADVEAAIEQIRSLIDGLSAEMRAKFRDGFGIIRENFVHAFQKLFHGGEADLVLVPETADQEPDLLEDPIEIVVQPPGKKLQSMTLLSGGEKSLTAIALLFAILESRPSPFCILDEIEAALDDVNIHRFTGFLRGYAERSQFVVITHRKGTMEIADNLYGITMEEYGVSKLISVQLDAAQ
ncbi:MAG: chromosome segregation protein SMC [Bacillota bacterium]|nr:chromosome segregation protein SMC [Bacillota bacterium]